MAKRDSLDKIITNYFSVVTKEDFLWKGTSYSPKFLYLSPLLFRDFTCPSFCGACCPRFSLDYLPTESYPKEVEEREVYFKKNVVTIYSDLQKENITKHCHHLLKDGRCGIYEQRPFTCDFELIRVLLFKDVERSNMLTQKLYGRGWNMLRVDGKRGAKCEITEVTEHSIDEVVRKINRLKQWCDYFMLDNKCQEILDWVEEVGPFLLKNYKIKGKTI